MAFTWNRDVVPAAAVGPAGAEAPSPSAAPSGEERDRAGQLLVDLFNYLVANTPSHDDLLPAFKDMHAAVAAYASQQEVDLMVPIKQVLTTIEEQRQLDPGIPQP